MLDGNSAEAHTSLAHVKATQDWDWHAAREREFQLAIGLDPGYATAHHWYAMSCLVPMGRLDEALEEMRLAQSLDPVSSIVARDLAIDPRLPPRLRGGARAVRSHDRAEPALLAGLLGARHHPGTAHGSRRGDRRLSARDRPRRRTARGCTPALGAHAGAVGQAQARDRRPAPARGHRAAALRVAVRVRRPCDFALGQADDGFECCERRCEDRAFDVLALKVDPRFAALHDDRRFREILVEIGLT